MMWSAALIPHGWLPCDGRLLSKDENKALFSLLGFNFGGDGVSRFALPDYRARVPVGVHPLENDYAEGRMGGSTTVGLTPANFPAHSHSLNAVSSPGSSTNFTGGVVLAGVGTSLNVTTPPPVYGPPGTVVPLGSNSIGGTGGSLPRNNVQPSLAFNFIIAVTGAYPSRS
jgi:microcystin-dependent protein